MKVSGSTETITDRRITGAELRRLVGAPDGASVMASYDGEPFFVGDEGTVTITWRTVTTDECEVEVLR
jgi:hypothetical protein